MSSRIPPRPSHPSLLRMWQEWRAGSQLPLRSTRWWHGGLNKLTVVSFSFLQALAIFTQVQWNFISWVCTKQLDNHVQGPPHDLGPSSSVVSNRWFPFTLLCSALHSAYSPSHGVIGMICIVQLVHDLVWPSFKWMEIYGWMMRDGLMRVGTVGGDFCMFRNTKNSSASLCFSSTCSKPG